MLAIVFLCATTLLACNARHQDEPIRIKESAPGGVEVKRAHEDGYRSTSPYIGELDRNGMTALARRGGGGRPGGGPRLTMPEIMAPADLVLGDDKVSICVNTNWTGDCDHTLLGEAQAVRIPLSGSIGLATNNYRINEDEIMALRTGGERAGEGGLIRIELENVVSGCDVQDANGAIVLDMVVFWDSVTVSPDKKTMSWDLTDDAASTLDIGCRQVQSNVDLIMTFRVPWVHDNGSIGNQLVTFSTKPVSEEYYPLRPISLTNDCADGAVPVVSPGIFDQPPLICSAPGGGALDFVFVIDTTGSMWDDIGAVKASSLDIINAIFENVADSRIAVIDYKDFPAFPYGGTSDYSHRLVVDFTINRDAVIGGIQSLSVGGGADWPESVYAGLLAALERHPDAAGNALSPWRAEASKSILLLGDAPPHDPEPFTSTTLQGVLDAAAAVGVPQSVASGGTPGVMMHSVSTSTATASAGVSIYSLLIGGDTTARSYFESLAAGTDGTFFTAADASTLVATILDIIDELGEDNLPPDTRWATASTAALWPPNRKLSEIEILGVMDPEGDAVTLAVTGITQDEPRTDSAPDATGVGTDRASVRAERIGSGNGRVYRISFTARDEHGSEATGSVMVCVPHDQGGNTVCEDDGQLIDSTAP